MGKRGIVALVPGSVGNNMEVVVDGTPVYTQNICVCFIYTHVYPTQKYELL